MTQETQQYQQKNTTKTKHHRICNLIYNTTYSYTTETHIMHTHTNENLVTPTTEEWNKYRKKKSHHISC